MPKMPVITGSGNNLKGAPFSAEAISESVQTLADGNRIVRRSAARLYRDSEGRFRREEMPKQLGVGGAVVDIPESISINDPVAGVRYSLNPKNQSYRQSEIKSDRQRAEEARQRAEQMKQREAERLQRAAERQQRDAEWKKRQEGIILNEPDKKDPAAKEVGIERKVEISKEVRKQIEVQVDNVAKIKIDSDQRKDDPNCRVESLGQQNIEGVTAEGTRTTTIIPAGKIGNEQPIEVVYEKWYSNELQMIIYSKLTDPRVGIQVYHLTNINRTEQPINLFQPPPEYHLVSETLPKPPAPPKPVTNSVKPVTAKPAELKKIT